MTQQHESETTSSIFVNDKGEQILDKKRLPHNYLFIAPAFMAAIQIAATKLGYTTQNPNARIQQWRNEDSIYQDIQLVAVHPAYFDTDNGERVYYLDHALHRLLELKHNYNKLIKVPSVVQQFPNDKISQEFYYNLLDNQKLITAKDLQEMHNDLKTMYETSTAPSGVKFYTDFVSSSAPIARNFQPVHDFDPRAFQKHAITDAAEYFLEPFNTQHQTAETPTAPELSVHVLERSFLLSAPTRSGKSFMAAMTVKRIVERLKELGKSENVILVVSGIADVMIEWQKAFQEHKALNQKNKDGTGATLFQFITRSELLEKGDAAIDEAFANGAENVVIALTLQDLSGSFKEAKNEYFVAHDFLKPREDGSNPVDFLIVDEAHFAAFNRYGEYRSMIAQTDYDEAAERANDTSDAPLSAEEFDEASQEFQQITPSVGTLYVSATPYNELLGGNTFSVQRGNMHIISKHDIQREAEAWLKEFPHLPEWYSPYFGLPKQHYFAVDPGAPIDTVFEVDGNGKFVRYNDAHSLIWNFLGYTFNGAFHFPQVVNDPEYVKAGLGNHVIVTVGSCAIADAIEDSLRMLQERYPDFAQQYNILNLSSEQSSHPYRSKTSDDISREIEAAEQEGMKTFAITVDRLGTGVTVEEWDTVVFWRKMSSAQKFDQMAGRAGTPYVVSMQDDEGNTIKRCEKPNVAVLSYAPDQMLEIVHQNALTVAKVKQDKEKISKNPSRKSLTKLLDDELSVIPTYMLHGGDSMVRMDAHNILDSVLASMQGKGPREYAEKVLVNLGAILGDKSLLSKLQQIDATDGNLSAAIQAFDLPEPKEGECHHLSCDTPAIESNIAKYGNKYCETHVVMLQLQEQEESAKTPTAGTDSDDVPVTPDTVPPRVVSDAEKALKDLEKRARNLVSVLLMFVALSPRAESSLKDVIASIEHPTDPTGARIAHHLGLDVEFLQELHTAGTFNYTLDTQFYLINKTLEDLDEQSTIDAVWEAMTILIEGFGNFSANEIPTPEKVARLLVDKAGLTEAFWESLSEWVAKTATMSEIDRAVYLQDLFKNVTLVTANTHGITLQATGDKVRFIDNGCKSAVIFVEIARRAEQCGIPLDMFEFYAIPTSPATYELIRKVYELLHWNLDHILFIEGIEPLVMNRLVELTIEERYGCQRSGDELCVFHDWTGIRKRREAGIDHLDTPSKTADSSEWREFSTKSLESAFEHIFDSMSATELQAAARDAWSRMKPIIEKFDYVISNPPYQLSNTAKRVGSDSTAVNIFQHFYEAGLYIANDLSMVFPGGRWMQRSQGMNGTADMIFSTASSIDWFPNGDEIEAHKKTSLFQGIRIPDGISVVTSIKNNSSFILNGIKANRPKNKEIVPLQKEYTSIVEKGAAFSRKFLKDRKSSVNIFGLRSFWTEKYPETVSRTELGDPFEKSVKAWLGDEVPGKAKRVREYYIDYNSVKWNDKRNYIASRWKVVGSQGYVSKSPSYATYQVIDNEHILGETWMVFGDFKTSQEAENYKDYIVSETGKVLLDASKGAKLAGWGSFVPDLEDYTNNNPVFTPDADLPEGHEYKGFSLDERLYKLFKLTEEEIAVIEER